jgi:hypothetical protein
VIAATARPGAKTVADLWQKSACLGERRWRRTQLLLADPQIRRHSVAFMDLAYEAFTEACTFGLDEAGICVSVTAKPGAGPTMLAIAGRCLGAQYVASLDVTVEGLLTRLPSPGARLLFARTEEDGRIVLVQSGTIEQFVTLEEIEGDTVEREAMTPEAIPTRRDEERAFDEAIEVDAPKTKAYQKEETGPFTRRGPAASEPIELEAVTRRSPETIRAFPPPPARLAPHPLVRARPQHE